MQANIAYRLLVGAPAAVLATLLLYLLMFWLIETEDVRFEADEATPVAFAERPVSRPRDPPPAEDAAAAGTRAARPVLPERGDLFLAVATFPDLGLVAFETPLLTVPEVDPITFETVGFPTLSVPLFTPTPRYPSDCKRQVIEGYAVVIYDVTEAGNVVNARIVEASRPCFARATLETFVRWRYSAMPGGGNKVHAESLVWEFSYTLEQQAGAVPAVTINPHASRIRRR